MSTNARAIEDLGLSGKPAPRRRRPSLALRALAFGLGAGMVALMVGDRALYGVTPQGIDPLQILDTQVKPNVLFVLGTDLGMGSTMEGGHWVGGDDPRSRFFLTKLALRDAIIAAEQRANMGLAHFTPANANKVLTGDSLAPTVPADQSGPLVYVADATQSPSASTWAGTFFNTSSTGLLFSLYDGDNCNATCTGAQVAGGNCSNQCEADVIRSFNTTENGFGTAYSSPGRFFIKSRLFRDNRRFRFRSGQLVGIQGLVNPANTSQGLASCPAPPTGLFPDTSVRPCFQIEAAPNNLSNEGPVATYYYSSGGFSANTANQNTCGAAAAVDVPACTVLNGPALTAALQVELPRAGTGVPTGLPAAAPQTVPTASLVNTNPNAAGGIQIGNGKVPINDTLEFAENYFDTVAQTGGPRNFVVLIIDGDENCDTQADAVNTATLMKGDTPPVETLVVVVGSPSATTAANANAIANAGSISGTRNALVARSLSQLRSALAGVMAEAVDTGTFSDQQSITESIFELVSTVRPQPSPPAEAFDPMNPDTRYLRTVPVLLQSTFDMPGFQGHLKAFTNKTSDPFPVTCRNEPIAIGRSCELWDAGVALNDRVSGVPAGVTFDVLAGTRSINMSTNTSALIQRRIITTKRNGIFAPMTAANPVPDLIDHIDGDFQTLQADVLALWPPAESGTDPVDPPAGSGIAVLDDELGIGTGVTFTQLRNDFGACTGAPLPAGCGTSDVNTARREARQMILAYTAGAKVQRAADGSPARDGSGNILYEKRPWVLAESTLAAPAIIGPPIDAEPSNDELARAYRQFKNGKVDASANKIRAINEGFGLRNAENPSSVTDENDATKKPLMSVTYHATNHMLHALRAGPCPASPGGLDCASSPLFGGALRENGGEELWAFVPYDQLAKLRSRMNPQSRDAHTYVIAAPVRFADIYVKGTFASANGKAISGDGVWRTVAIFGRGIGGKHLTALDVTSPGEFTRHSLRTNLPLVLWNRGNPDTQDGTPGGTNNNTGAGGTVDKAAYARMGQTWSVPAIAYVGASAEVPGSAVENRTARRALGNNFVAYAGSGYATGADPNEGATFFAFDPLTGDMIRNDLSVPGSPGASGAAAHPLPNGTSTFIVPRTAIVAPVAAFNRGQVSTLSIGNPAGEKATSAYFPDLHGRLWRFDTTRPQVAPTEFFAMQPADGDQPGGTGVALIGFPSTPGGTPEPHIFLETGWDNRVPAPVSTFKIYGFRDNGGSAVQLFSPINFPASHRGNVQPATAFECAALLGNGDCDLSQPMFVRVFFAGIRNDLETSSPPGTPPPTCEPTFNSVLFAVDGITGGAAYDLDGAAGNDLSLDIAGQRINAVRVSQGRLVVDTGLQAEMPPPPPAPPAEGQPSGSTSEVFLRDLRAASAVCR